MAQFFDIGKSTAKTVAHSFSQDIAEAFTDAVANSKKVLNFASLERDITKRIRETYMKAIEYAQKNMLGTRSPTGAGRVKNFHAGAFSNYGAKDSDTVGVIPPKGTVTWRSLSPDTISEKRRLKRKSPDSFFQDTGKLKQFLTRNARRIVNNTGVVKIDRRSMVHRNPKMIRPRNALGRFLPETIPVADLSMRIMPNIPAAFLPGIKANNIGKNDPNQRFEAQVVNDLGIEEKLYGPMRENQRALLQPVFTFWTNYYIPRQIEQALKAAI